MRRFLLVALCMGFLLPTTVSADTVYLLLREYEYDYETGIETEHVLIPMTSINQCASEAKRIKEWTKSFGYICVYGK